MVLCAKFQGFLQDKNFNYHRQSWHLSDCLGMDEELRHYNLCVSTLVQWLVTWFVCQMCFAKVELRLERTYVLMSSHHYRRHYEVLKDKLKRINESSQMECTDQTVPMSNLYHPDKFMWLIWIFWDLSLFHWSEWCVLKETVYNGKTSSGPDTCWYQSDWK